MAIARVLSTTTQNGGQSASPCTLAHTTLAYQNDSYLLIWRSWDHPAGVPTSNPAWDGSTTGVTLLVSHDKSELWYLKNPSVKTANVTYTHGDGSNSNRSMIAVQIDRVAVTDPIVDSDFAAGDITVDSTPTGLVVDFQTLGGVASPGTSTPGAGQTELIDNWYEGDGGTRNWTGAASWEPGTGSGVVMSWTQTEAMHVASSWRGAAGAGSRMILAMWKRFVEDLRAGLVPPDELRRRYRNLVAI